MTNSLLSTIETRQWTDPLVGLQVKKFLRFVVERSEQGVMSSKVRDEAEYLCEWSRNLLNRTFGRTSRAELEVITELFRETARQVREWAVSVTNHEESSQISVFAYHIEQRTGLEKVSS